MTDLLDQALKAVSRLPSGSQDQIALAMLALAGDELDPIALTPEERQAIARSKQAAARGEFASDSAMAELWAKHGL